MASDAHPYPIRVGSKEVVYGKATAATGTLTIAAGGTYTLYDATGTAVAAHTAQNVTGYDNTALAAPQVWINLDTTGLTVGVYDLVFTFSAAGSDGMTRIYKPSIMLVIKSVGDD